MKIESPFKNNKVVFCCYVSSMSSFFILLFIQADVIERLRLQYTKDLLKVVDIVLSHQVIN